MKTNDIKFLGKYYGQDMYGNTVVESALQSFERELNAERMLRCASLSSLSN